MHRLPNILSIARMFFGPIVILLLALDAVWALWACLAVMLLAELSDMADGHLARRMKAVSQFGKIADPLADSLYRALVFLAFMDAGWMPVWMVAIIIARDILVSYLRIFAQQQGITMAARTSGKLKAIVQAVAQIGTVVLVLFGGAVSGEGGASGAGSLAYALLLLATVMTAWSAVDYLRGFLASIRTSPNTV